MCSSMASARSDSVISLVILSAALRSHATPPCIGLRPIGRLLQEYTANRPLRHRKAIGLLSENRA